MNAICTCTLSSRTSSVEPGGVDYSLLVPNILTTVHESPCQDDCECNRAPRPSTEWSTWYSIQRKRYHLAVNSMVMMHESSFFKGREWCNSVTSCVDSIYMILCTCVYSLNFAPLVCGYMYVCYANSCIIDYGGVPMNCTWPSTMLHMWMLNCGGQQPHYTWKISYCRHFLMVHVHLMVSFVLRCVHPIGILRWRPELPS